MSYMGELYRNVVRIQKCITVNTVVACKDLMDNVGARRAADA